MCLASLSSTKFEFAFSFWQLQLWFVPIAKGVPGMHHCLGSSGHIWQSVVFEWPLFRSPRSLAGFLPSYITGSSCIGSGSWPGHYISPGLKTCRPWWAESCESEEDSNTGKAETDHWGPGSENSSRGNMGPSGGAVGETVPAWEDSNR